MLHHFNIHSARFESLWLTLAHLLWLCPFCVPSVICSCFWFRLYDIIFHSKIVRPNLIKCAGDVWSFGLLVAAQSWFVESMKMSVKCMQQLFRQIYTAFDMLIHTLRPLTSNTRFITFGMFPIIFKQTANKIWPHSFYGWSLSFSLLLLF